MDNVFFNVREAGCTGNGKEDELLSLQNAIKKHKRVFIPNGTYMISGTLRLPTDTHIKAEPEARIVFAPKKKINAYDFLVSNEDNIFGNSDISIDGGIWDGGNGNILNKLGTDIFGIEEGTGACMNFVGVKNLSLKNLKVANPVAFYVRMSRIKDFEIKNITFSSEKMTTNQDGLHFGGMVYNGVIENIRSETFGQTGDDMLAFNADDCVLRSVNLGLNCGPIENIRVKGVFAESCLCAVRFLSVSAPIRNIHISDLNCGCWGRGINCDGARYCRTPIFSEGNVPEGVGLLENITFEDCSMHFTRETKEPLICLETNADNFKIINMKRPKESDKSPESPSFCSKNLVKQIICRENTDTTVLTDKTQECTIKDFKNIELKLRKD